MLRYGCAPEWGWERFRNSRDAGVDGRDSLGIGGRHASEWVVGIAGMSRQDQYAGLTLCPMSGTCAGGAAPTSLCRLGTAHRATHEPSPSPNDPSCGAALGKGRNTPGRNNNA